MKTRKILAVIGAALLMIGVSAPASAFDCDKIAEDLKDLAIALRCKDDATDANPGEWTQNPIWQKRGSGSCEPQNSLARKLHEQREFKGGSKPPKNDNNGVAGAAGDVSNEKYPAAVDKLDSFLRDAYKKRLNMWTDVVKFPNSLAAKTYFVTQVGEARACVCLLTECED